MSVDSIVELINEGLLESERQLAYGDPLEVCPCDLTDDDECDSDCRCIHHVLDDEGHGEHPNWGLVLAQWGWPAFCAFGEDVHPLYFQARDYCRVAVSYFEEA